VALLGPAGSGKSTALAGIRRTTANLHSAYLDLADRDFGSPTGVLTALVLQLSVRRRRLGGLTFSRFLLGRLVTRLPFPDDSPDARTKEIKTLLHGLRARRLPEDLRGLVVKLGEFAGPMVNVPPGSGDAAVAVVESALVRFRRTPGLHWWGTAAMPSVSALVDLHRMANDGTPQERQAVEIRLCEAFLADLEASYRGSPLFRSPAHACFALLDNADDVASQRLLELLARARSRLGRVPDPLLVIATLGRASHVLRLPAPDPPDKFDLANWRKSLDFGDAASRFHAVVLRDFTEDEVIDLGTRHGHHSRDQIAAIYGATAGHPAGVTACLTCGATSEQLDTLLAGPLASWREELVTCSATRNLRIPTMQAALSDGTPTRAKEIRRLLADQLWRGAGDEPTTHPWIRRLLLAELAARDDASPDSWTAVHQRLHEHYRAAGASFDEAWVAGCYHALAAGNLLQVIGDLEKAVEVNDLDWFAALRSIATAPSLGRAQELPSGPDRLRVVLTRLVADLRTANDPMRIDDKLLMAVAGHAVELSALLPIHVDKFLDLAREYEAKAESCRRRTGR